jgi:leucyl aminopeptidase
VTTWTLRSASPAKTRCDTVVVGVLSEKSRPRLAPGADDVADAYGRKLAPLLASLGVTGKAGEVVKVPTSRTIASPVLVLVGLGAEVTPTAVRRAAGAAARAVSNSTSVALALPADEPALVRAATEGYALGGYTFTTYKSGGNGSAKRPGDVVVLSPVARKKDAVAAFETAQVLAGAVARTRDWVNTPPNDLRPPGFADAITEAVKARPRGAAKIEVEVLDETQLAELGCGGILSVGQASDAPPRLVRLSYAPKDATSHLALVGKGITFDTGGLSIKPAANMHEMKSDMAGAAAVVAATLAIADLGLPVRVTTYASIAENMLGAAATRPGDVVTMYGGKTVEILNTDAEGRMVLGDALVLATEQQPDVIVDVATLTGHMVVALGGQVGGVLGDEATVDGVLAAAGEAGEDHWPMPIPDAMVERIHSSKIADLAQHDLVRWGGGLFAAAFLREFTAGIPWAHLDIAGPSYNSGGPSGHWTSGGTGVAVTTLVEYARSLAPA